MNPESDHQHHVRRVVLPSGKTIEVVYYDDRTAAAGPLPGQDVERDLHVCASCSSELVYPVVWQESGSTHWEVTLRCPNCEWCATGVFSQDAVERFDEELDRGTELLVRDLKRLMTANLEDEIERFVTALENDFVLPEDF